MVFVLKAQRRGTSQVIDKNSDSIWEIASGPSWGNFA
jgi:hypothetical protein